MQKQESLKILSDTNSKPVVAIPIARPPWTQLGKKLESLTRKALYTYDMVPPSGKIAIALSGGKDSLALLFLLKAISGRGFPPFDLHAIHIGGKYTCGAGIGESFLRKICDEIEVPLIIRETHQKLEDLECYSCSRERRRLLFEATKEVGAAHIAFGHHRDDAAQTLLMNMLHKGEFASLLPTLEMKDFGITILRPLIFASEDQIKQFAKHHGFARITCQCPVGQNSMRKQVDQLLSEMEALFPNARANIAQAGLLYGSDKARQP